MVTSVRLDTLDYAQKLESAGVPPEQAALQAKALGEALAGSEGFRDDLAQLEGRLARKFADIDLRLESVESKITNLGARLEVKIDAVRNELTLLINGKIETLRWMFGVLVALNGAMFVQLIFK
jgi:hypothetical protein